MDIFCVDLTPCYNIKNSQRERERENEMSNG